MRVMKADGRKRVLKTVGPLMMANWVDESGPDIFLSSSVYDALMFSVYQTCFDIFKRNGNKEQCYGREFKVIATKDFVDTLLMYNVLDRLLESGFAIEKNGVFTFYDKPLLESYRAENDTIYFRLPNEVLKPIVDFSNIQAKEIED